MKLKTNMASVSPFWLLTPLLKTIILVGHSCGVLRPFFFFFFLAVQTAVRINPELAARKTKTQESKTAFLKLCSPQNQGPD